MCRVIGLCVFGSFLADEDLDQESLVTSLFAAVQRFKASGIKLAADFSVVRGDSISVQSLIGTMQLTSFMNGAAFKFPQVVVPFGSVLDSWCSEAKVGDSAIRGINYSQVIADYSQGPVTHVCNVLDPKSKYLDSYECLAESTEYRSVDKLFRLETLGIEYDSFSNYR